MHYTIQNPSKNMAEFNNYDKDLDRGEIFTKAVKAGKRTYFFDVKTTRNNECYITITESKKKNIDGSFFYEKHKIFLYKEDFEKFSEGFNEATEFIRKNNAANATEFSNVNFEDLGNTDK